MKHKRTLGDVAFDTLNTALLIVLSIICIYPMYYCLVASISNPASLAASGGIMLYPKGIQFDAFKAVFTNRDISTGYLNTIFYVTVGTLLNVVLTLLGAYVLSRKKLYLGKALNLLVVITMFVNGGMVPLYLLIKNLGLLNTRWAVLLPVAVNTYNLIMARTYFSTIPESLEESARIDGASEFKILFRIMIPLAGPIIAVISLYYAVSHWNAWFGAMIYLKDRNKYPIQLILREILILNEVSTASQDFSADKLPIEECIKYATIIVATVPILCIYPFVQKYFVKGVMIGAVKG